MLIENDEILKFYPTCDFSWGLFFYLQINTKGDFFYIIIALTNLGVFNEVRSSRLYTFWLID